MKLTADDVLEALPTLLARETDVAKRQELLKTAALFEEARDRTLLCDHHGIKVFEYKGKRSVRFSEDMLARWCCLEDQVPDSVRVMAQDLYAIMATVKFQTGEILSPPEPQYDEEGLVNGEAFRDSASAIWARTAMPRGMWELLRTRLGAKLSRLHFSSGKARTEQANRLKKEFAAAIDLLGETGGHKTHGAATLIEWAETDGTSRLVTLPYAALKLTCALILINLEPPSKGEVRKTIEAKRPNLDIKDAAWVKVWRAAGLDWLPKGKPVFSKQKNRLR